jgi:hypothetical protein
MAAENVEGCPLAVVRCSDLQELYHLRGARVRGKKVARLDQLGAREGRPFSGTRRADFIPLDQKSKKKRRA